MEFVFILISHLLGDYIFQPKWMVENKPTNILVLILHVLVYSLTLYIAFPLLVLVLQIFSGLTMVEFLSTHELTSINNWDFDVFLYIFIGHLLIDIWTHRMSKKFHEKYLKTDSWKSEHFSLSIDGVDQLLHMLHLYIIYSIIFL